MHYFRRQDINSLCKGGVCMPNKMTILVGTVGQGIMRSADGGETWQRVGINQGMHSDALVRTLAN